MITNLFLSVLEISMSTGIVVLALLLLSPFLNKRYAAKWKYWIWLFLAFRLLIPVQGSSVRSGLDTLAKAVTPAATQSQDDQEDAPLYISVPSQRIVVEIPAQMTAPVATQSEKSSAGVTPLDLVAFVWFMGGLGFLVFHLHCYQRYKKQIIREGTYRTDNRVLYPLIFLSNELQIKSRIPVIEYSEAASPMIIGFRRPVLVLPEEQYSEEELFFILKHELIHLKRRDVWFKLLLVAANAAHWFNPLVWIMQKEAVVDMELSCDERVVQGTEYTVRKAYTETLFSTLHRKCAGKTVLSTQFYGGKQIMKKRFKNILIKARKRNGLLLLLCAVILTVAFGTLIGCSVAASGQSVEDIVLETAEELTAGLYAAAQADFPDYRYSDWRVTSLEQCHTYEDFDGMVLLVYQMNFEYLSDAPEEVLLAGGMAVTEDGWVTPDYAGSRFLIFRQEGDSLSFVTWLFENDCFPGDELFDEDLRLQMEEMAASASVPALPEEADNSTTVLTTFMEGERVDFPATLYAGDGYSIYITDEDWQQYAPDAWQAVVEGNVVFDGQIQLKVTRSQGKNLSQVQEEWAGEGYEAYNHGLEKRDSDMVYRVSLYESGNEVWEVYHCFPNESAVEEGWGQILSMITDTFAVSGSADNARAQLGSIWNYSASRMTADVNVLDFATGMQIILPEEWIGKVAAEVDPGLEEAEDDTLVICEKSNMEADAGGVLFYLYYLNRSVVTEEPFEIWGGEISRVLGVYRQGNREYALIFELPREMNYVEGNEEMQKAYEEVFASVDKVQIVTDNMPGFTECGVDDLDWIIEY